MAAGYDGQQNVVVVQQPVVMQRKIFPDYQRDWVTGLCDCGADQGTCCMAFFCCSCYACYMSAEMGENCCISFCTPGCVTTGVMALRTKVRTAFGIGGSICEDCACATFCLCCSLAQLAREWKYLNGQLPDVPAPPPYINGRPQPKPQ